MKITLGVIGLLWISAVSSQSIIIKDKNTGQPISDVFVYHENQSAKASSENNGNIDLQDFPEEGNIIFQHPNYKRYILNGLDLSHTKSILLEERITSFDEVVISANKWSQNPSAVAQDISILKRKEISFQNPATSADLLESSGEVFVQKSQLGGGSPMLRGFAANSVLLVVDGVRLNNAIYRSGNLQNIINIDPNAISQSEVIYGPGSIIYGSDALGGVMNFSTINPQWSSKTEVGINMMARYASAANEQTGHIDTYVSSKNFTYFGSFTYSGLDDLRAGANRSSDYEGYFERKTYAKTIGGSDFLVSNDNAELQVGSGFDMFSAINKAKWKLGEYADIGIGLFISNTTDIPRYDRLSSTTEGSDSLTYAEWYYGPQKWVLNNYTFNYYKPTALFDQTRLTVAYQRYEESRNDRRFGDSSLRTQEESVDLYTINLDFDKGVGDDRLYYGIDIFTNEVGSNAFRKDVFTHEITETDTRYPDLGSNYTSFAGYINYLKEYNKWTISAGARYSKVILKANSTANADGLFDGNFKLNNHALNGMLSLVYRQTKNTKWSAIVSSGFRSPNVDDVGKLFEISDDIVTIPNPDLNPEYSYNQELSFKQKINKIEVNWVGYHSLLVDAIVRGDFMVNGEETAVIDGETKFIRAQVNGGEAHIFGTAISAKAKINDSWQFSGSFNYSKGKTREDNEPLRHIPPAFGRVGLTYSNKLLKAQVYSLYNFTKKAADIPDSEIIDKAEIYTPGGSPGWSTLNIKADWMMSEVFNIQAGVENILDQHYRTYSSGISAAGRNIYISLRAKI